jgi:hypothetical protein
MRRAMTAQPAGAAPEPTVVPHLHLVDPHEHTWELRSVDFDHGTAVQEFGCTKCDGVWFR